MVFLGWREDSEWCRKTPLTECSFLIMYLSSYSSEKYVFSIGELLSSVSVNCGTNLCCLR